MPPVNTASSEVVSPSVTRPGVAPKLVTAGTATAVNGSEAVALAVEFVTVSVYCVVVLDGGVTVTGTPDVIAMAPGCSTAVTAFSKTAVTSTVPPSVTVPADAVRLVIVGASARTSTGGVGRPSQVLWMRSSTTSPVSSETMRKVAAAVWPGSRSGNKISDGCSFANTQFTKRLGSRRTRRYDAMPSPALVTRTVNGKIWPCRTEVGVTKSQRSFGSVTSNDELVAAVVSWATDCCRIHSSAVAPTSTVKVPGASPRTVQLVCAVSPGRITGRSDLVACCGRPSMSGRLIPSGNTRVAAPLRSSTSPWPRLM